MSEYRVDTTVEADRHARAIDAWWREHRTGSAELVIEELAQAIALLARVPRLGPPYTHRDAPPEIRRLLMRRVRCHVYYTVDDHERVVLVRAIWHTSRAHGPF